MEGAKDRCRGRSADGAGDGVGDVDGVKDEDNRAYTLK